MNNFSTHVVDDCDKLELNEIASFLENISPQLVVMIGTFVSNFSRDKRCVIKSSGISSLSSAITVSAQNNFDFD